MQNKQRIYIRIYKERLQIDLRKTNTSVEKWAREMNKQLTEEKKNFNRHEKMFNLTSNYRNAN
jgi:hypothetical protein